jgi:hypothetical protein
LVPNGIPLCLQWNYKMLLKFYEINVGGFVKAEPVWCLTLTFLVVTLCYVVGVAIRGL